MKQRGSGKGVRDGVILANDGAGQGLQVQEGPGQELERSVERIGKKEVREECTPPGVKSTLNCVSVWVYL